MSPLLSLSLSVLLLVLNAFFVAAEFAVVSARRHRLEVAAAYGGRGARAAVRNSRELSLGLAGAQLGITLATLGLGALAKPAVADLLEPLLALTPLPEAFAAGIATVLAVAVVVFLHMVVGEMAPKSWAISHPERSAVLLGVPFRAFTTATRWVLEGLSAVADRLLRIWHVEPVGESSTVQGPAELRLLIRASREHGLLEAGAGRLLTRVLELSGTPVYAVTLPWADVDRVPLTATADDVVRAASLGGHSRLVVVGGDGRPVGLVHVRDALLTDGGTPVVELVYETVRLDVHATVVDALGRMRAERAQLALVVEPGETGGPRVTAGTGDTVIGITALEDLLARVLAEFEDETDRPSR
ncbi:MAG: hemolysin family protein [Lapillicoccus sp.]